MLPGIAPCAIVKGVANGIVGDWNTVIISQQIAPLAVAVGVCILLGKSSYRPSGIRVNSALGDITSIVVIPYSSGTCRLIVLSPKRVSIFRIGALLPQFGKLDCDYMR